MRLLVFAPHPDDELLGCAGLMLHALEQGGAVQVVVVSDGGLGGPADLRQSELQAGLAALDVLPAQCWCEADDALPLDEAIQQRYRACVALWRPQAIALPAPGESHPDHRRLTRGLLTALTGQWSGDLFFYETTTPQPSVNHCLPLDLSRKLAALACHASQQAQYDYQGYTRGLAQLRGASLGVPAAEAHTHFEWDGSAQNFFEHRPLVSVVVRAHDAALLAVALQSLCEQSYDQIELVLVWHGEGPAPTLPRTLQARVIAGPGRHAANLNAGLAAAQGAYVAFLDQDDVWLPDHLALLLTELIANPELDLAYGDYRLVTCAVQDGQVVVQHTGEAKGQDWRAGRLLAGNHIPLNAFVCRLRWARRLGFDETLQAYEDWDFLARAELDGAGFARIPEVVCEYRLYPQAGESADLTTLHQRKGYLAWRTVVLDKIAARITPQTLASVMELLQALESERDGSLQEVKRATTERDEATGRWQFAQYRLGQLRRWADLLTPLAGNPVSALAGRAFDGGPVFAVVLPVCDPEPEFLAETVHSVLRQTYPHWELCIADDASTRPAVLDMLSHLEVLAHTEPRIRVLRRPARGGIVAASQSAIALSQAPWLSFLDHDDRLHTDALLELAAMLRQQPSLECLYTDSRMTDRNGVMLHQYHKPDWAPETLLHLNYINHFSVVRRDVFDAVGGLRDGYDGSQDWDLWLRLASRAGLQVGHVAQPLYDWRATETSVAYSGATKPYAWDAALRCLQDHYERHGHAQVQCRRVPDGIGLRTAWQAPLQPLTAIIPTHRNPQDLQRLLASLAASAYPGLEVLLIGNNVATDDAHTHRLLQDAAQHPRWRVVIDNQPFNWAALNNAAARLCHTPWLLFLNDDIELGAPDTLEQLARYLSLDAAIGAVGARLDYGPEQGGGIQHDGIATDPTWVARNICDLQDGKGLGIPRNVSAVTGACLLTPRAVFERCGGFEERLAVSYNDVDYGLHVRRLGYRVVQASDVVCIHRESRTRGGLDSDAKREELAREGQFMRDKWGGFLRETYRLQYIQRFAGSRIVSIPDA